MNLNRNEQQGKKEFSLSASHRNAFNPKIPLPSKSVTAYKNLKLILSGHGGKSILGLLVEKV